MRDAGRTAPRRSGGTPTSPAPAHAPAPRLRTWILALAVAAAVVATHAPVLGSRAIALDDPSLVQRNVLVLNPGPESVRRFFTEVLEPSTLNAYYMPLSMTSLMLDAAAGGSGTNLVPFHVTSLALHTLGAVLLFLVFRRLAGNDTAAALGALLWGLHPLTVEAVASAGERKTVLATAFAFASTWLHVRSQPGNDRNAAIGSAACFALALLSKPSAMALPLALLLISAGTQGRGWIATARSLAPHFVLALASAAISALSVRSSWMFGSPPPLDPVRLGLQVIWLLGFYVRQLVWPVRLSVVYEPPSPFTFTNPEVLAGVALALLCTATAWAMRRPRPALWTGWCVFFVLLAPTFGILTFSPTIAYDRYLHLPLLGLALAAAGTIAALLGAQRFRSAQASRALAGLVLAVCALEAWGSRAALTHWRDSVAIWSRAVEVAPGMAMAHNGLGATWSEAGERDRALASFERAARLDPGYGDAQQNLGRELLLAGRANDALPWLAEAARLKPGSATAALQHGNGLVSMGRIEEGESELRRSLELDPHYAPALSSLGMLLLEHGRVAEGVQRLREAVVASGGEPRARFRLATALNHTHGPSAEVASLLEGVLQDTPDDLPALNELAWLRATAADAALRDTSQALAVSQRALEHGGANEPGVLDTRAAALASAGRFAEAIATAERALERARAAGDSGLVREASTRLAGYRAGRPFRQVGHAPAD